MLRDIIKTIKDEVTNLRLKTNVIQKDEYVRRVAALEGAVRLLAEAATKAEHDIAERDGRIEELRKMVPKSKGAK